MSTVAEYLRQEGMQQGLLQGMQASHADVWQTAERKAKLETAKNLLAAKISTAIVMAATGLEKEDLAHLDDAPEK